MKFGHPVKDRNLQTRAGSCNNNDSIKDLAFTICLGTFLIRCYPVAKDMVEGNIAWQTLT